uniref:Rab-GAP TBC domain-containing protein n=1 Tax=Heterorhabditis bacteriophora TaxID=37862 RepID=A0A1I7WEL1_HETBA
MFGGTKTKDPGVFHTTGLILEERPSNLPAKSDDEAARHRQLYYDMIEQTKKKELRAEKERRQARAVQKRLEEQAVAACRVWTEQILPKWSEMLVLLPKCATLYTDAFSDVRFHVEVVGYFSDYCMVDCQRDSKRCRELWWQGIPPKVRGCVWALVVGNDLNITPEVYEIHSARAEERLRNQACDSSEVISTCREHTVSQIHLDVSRTFPTLGIFQKGGPYYDHLLKLLSIYACYRPDIGYVQSMSFIAAVLLLQMEPFPAFIVFANLLNRPLQVAALKLSKSLQSAFFGLRQPQMTEYFIAYDLYLEQELLGLHQHLDKLDVRPDVYLIEWSVDLHINFIDFVPFIRIYTLFSKSLPLDVTCRIWDVYLRDGEEFIFKTALGILRMYESRLLSMDFDDCVEFLTRLPDSLCGADLFRNIELFMRPYASNVETSKSKKGFLQVLISILQEVDNRVNPGGSVAHAQINSNVQEFLIICIVTLNYLFHLKCVFFLRKLVVYLQMFWWLLLPHITGMVSGEQSIIEGPQESFVSIGKTIVLNCKVENQKGAVQWMKNGFGLGVDRQLKFFPRYSMIGSASKGEYNLQIINATVGDDDIYACQISEAAHEPSVISNPAKLTVLIKTRQIVFGVGKPPPRLGWAISSDPDGKNILTWLGETRTKYGHLFSKLYILLLLSLLTSKKYFGGSHFFKFSKIIYIYIYIYHIEYDRKYIICLSQHETFPGKVSSVSFLFILMNTFFVLFD